MTKLKPPLISVRDSSDTQIGVLIDYFNDSIERFLEGKVSVLTLSALDENNNRELLNEGNFLSFTYNGEDYHLTIVKKDEDEDVITITAWSLVLELNNETKNPYTGSNMTFEQYLNAFDGERILTVNINEVSDKKISHTWDSQQTMLERLFSLATVFDAEIEFETILAEDGSLEKLQVNAYKAHSSTNQGIGKNRSAEVFYFGEDITTVKKSTDIMNLYTAIRPIGKDGLTLNGYKMEDIKDEDGETLFFLKNGMIYAPRARELYPSNLINKGDRWTVYDWDTEYDSQATLCGNALAKLRDELSTPAITWTIEGYIDANIGDTISVHDNGYKPALLLEARINSQRISMTDPSSNETTFSNIKQVDSQVSDDLIARMNELIQANKTYDVQILTSNGYSFKNGQGSTTLTARVMDGPKDASRDFVINWYRETDLIGPNASITVQASSINEKVVYRIIAYKDGVERGRNELTLINVNDGVQGPQGEQGPAGQDGIPGKDGLGITNTSITYAQSTSGTTAPSTGWTEQVPTLIKGQYLWTKTTWTYTDKSTETGYTVSYNAKDGNDGNDGVAGKDGVGIANTSIQYAQSTSGTTKPTSGWSTTIPIVASGNYLWTKTTWTYTDGTFESGYSVAKMGERGPQGLQGIQGPKGDQGIAGRPGADGLTSYTHIAYANSADGTKDFSVSDSNRIYIGVYVDFNATDSTSPSSYQWSLIKGADGADGAPGKPGADGRTPYFHTAYANSADGSSGFSTTDSNGKLYLGTCTDYTQADPTDYRAYTWVKIKGEQGPQGIQGPSGANGQSLYTWLKYADDANGSGMSEAPDGKKYIGLAYNRPIPTESSNPEDYTWSLIQGANGVNGADGKTYYTWVKYADSATGSGLSDNPAGKSYIGLAYNKTTSTESTNPGDYSWSLIKGDKGDTGNGIAKTTISYGVSSSGTTAPTSWSSTIPTVSPSNYLWTKTVITYTDNTTSTSYSVGKMGEQGAKGDKGDTGATLYTWVKYANDANGSGMSDYPSGKKYIGLAYNKTTATESSIASDYQWALIQGEQGIPGQKGDDGATLYTWIKYADNASGSGLSDSANGKKYVGIAYNKTTSTESTNPADYTWSLIQGPQGPAGQNGKGVSSYSITYQAGTSGTTPPTGTWTTTIPSVPQGRYLWTKMVITYTDNTSSTSYSVSYIPSNGATGATGNGVSSITTEFYLSTSKTTQTGGSWSTTQPTWSPGKYVWTRNKITYTNDSTEYTTPQCSSEWEAVNEIQVGGRNLLFKTGWFDTSQLSAIVGDSSKINLAKTIITDDSSPSGKAYRINKYKKGTENVYGGCCWNMPKKLVAGKKYTWSVYVRGVGTVNAFGPEQGGLKAVNLTNTWTKVSHTFTANDNKYYQFTFYGDLEFDLYLTNLMLEEGNIATTWSPAPEDQEAQIDNIQVGGRNLLKDTANFHNNGRPSGSKNGWLDSYHSTIESEKYNGLTVRSLKNVTTDKEMCNYYFTGFNLGDTYTLSFWAKGTIDTFRCYFYGDSGYVGARAINASIPYDNSLSYGNGYCAFINPKITNWTRISVTWELNSVGNINIPKKVLIRTEKATSGDLYVCGVKLEKGNKATDWSPAPEDTQDQIDQANENISNKVDQGAYDQDKSVIYDDINKKLDDEEFREFQKIMNELKGSYDSFVGEGGRYEQELKNSLEREQAIVKEFGDKVNQLNFINTYIRESEEGLVIGAKNSPMQMLLSKDSLSFMDGGQTVAYFSNQSFYINRGAVVESLQVGVHKLTKVGNEHTVIQYIPN